MAEEPFSFPIDVIDSQARQIPTRPALTCLQDDTGLAETLTYSSLSQASQKTALALLNSFTAPPAAAAVSKVDSVTYNGLLSKGDRVIVILPRVPSWWIILLAVMRLGAIPCPAPTSLTARDLIYRAEKAGASMVIFSAATANMVLTAKRSLPSSVKFVLAPHSADFALGGSSASAAAAAATSFGGNTQLFSVLTSEGCFNLAGLTALPLSPLTLALPKTPTRLSDTMLVYFTSGTTGYPKMVAHRYSYALGHENSARRWHGAGGDDIHFTITDTGWAKAAWGTFFGQFVVGCTVFAWDYARFQPKRALEVLASFKITSFCAPPTAYRALVKEDLGQVRLPHLKNCTSAGEPLNPEVSAFWKKVLGLDIREGYGQTESVLLLATLLKEPLVYGSVGKCMPGFRLAVVDDDLRLCAPGQEGNLAVDVSKGIPAGVFEGYVKAFGPGGVIQFDEEANRKVFRGGWYLTGDRAFQDDQTRFWFVGRSDDVIKTSGYRVGPFEVESALVEHPSVLEAAVVGIPDEQKGQVIKAFVVLAPGRQASPDLAQELQDHTRKVTAPYKVPKVIEFVTELPKTISGKIRRVELREKSSKL